MPSLHSHDLFDTLIARRCIEPRNVFFEVEKTARIPGFAAKRMEAEASCYSAPYDLDDIYAQLQKMLNLGDEEKQRLKRIEIDKEIENAIPIQVNLNKVHDGDILISDIYLPIEVIRKMLKAVGFGKHVGIIVTSHGKQSGTIWPTVNDRLRIEKHRGNNHESDIQSPLKHGIYAEHTSHFALDPFEQFFRAHGFELLTRLMRELRLGFEMPILGHEFVHLKRIQFQINIPLLILVATFINNFAKAHGVGDINFCSRDCYYLYKVYCELFAADLSDRPARYFYTSRLSRVAPSPDYLAYATTLIGHQSLVVDLCGTGWSLGTLYKRLDRQPHTLLLHRAGKKSEELMQKYRQISRHTPPDNLFSMTTNEDVHGELLEMINYTSHGMVEDVVTLGDLHIDQPVFEPPHYPESVRKAIAVNEEAHGDFARVLKHYATADLTAEVTKNSEKIESILVALCKNLELRAGAGVLEDLISYHRDQDAHTLWKLSNTGASRSPDAGGGPESA